MHDQPDQMARQPGTTKFTLVITALLTPLLFVALAAVASADGPVSTEAHPNPLFGCPGVTLVVHNVDCDRGTAEAFSAPSASATPDFTRYGCAGGDRGPAPWCDTPIEPVPVEQ